MGALAETLIAEEPLPTVTVAVNVILSPEAADLGTTTWASDSGVVGGDFSTVMSQVVLLAQLPSVNVGGANAGVLLLAITAAVTVPGSAEEAPAVILKNTVLPGCTLLSEAVTLTVGFVGGVGVGVGVGVVDGVVEGGVVEGGVVEGGVAGLVGDAVGVARGRVDPAGVLVALAEVVVFGVLDALAELDAFTALGAGVEVDGFAVGDGVAAVVAARADVVMPLEITKMPVAKPSVTGRECGDRMRTPCLC
jgi:hypothetical protein